MSRRITTPSNQQLLTNISVVRLKKSGKRFEIACYPNKVKAWRDGIEKDIDEVVQSMAVYTNVSKGEHANKQQLQRCFGTKDVKAIVMEVLSKGELQVTAAERAKQSAAKRRDIASIIAEKWLNPDTMRPYTPAMIERAMVDDLHYSVHATASAKAQAAAVARQLAAHMPLQRAKMRVKVVGSSDKEDLVAALGVERDDANDDAAAGGAVYLLDPGQLGAFEARVHAGGGRIEVLELAVLKKGDAAIDKELEGDDGRAAEERSEAKKAAATTTASSSSSFKCKTCSVEFADSNAHRAHFKSDWHRENLRRTTAMDKLPPLNEAEFQIEASLRLEKKDADDDFYS